MLKVYSSLSKLGSWGGRAVGASLLCVATIAGPSIANARVVDDFLASAFQAWGKCDLSEEDNVLAASANKSMKIGVSPDDARKRLDDAAQCRGDAKAAMAPAYKTATEWLDDKPSALVALKTYYSYWLTAIDATPAKPDETMGAYMARQEHMHRKLMALWASVDTDSFK